MSIRTDLERVAGASWSDKHVCIKPMETQNDLVYALFGCQLTEEQKELVNSAGFSIGRAYLFREDNYPCIIYNAWKEPVGFINLDKWLGAGDAYSWSFYIDKDHQGKGYGIRIPTERQNRSGRPGRPIRTRYGVRRRSRTSSTRGRFFHPVTRQYLSFSTTSYPCTERSDGAYPCMTARRR